MIRPARILALTIVALLAVAMVWADTTPERRRRITPVNNASTATQAINETRDDTARINAVRRARSTSYMRDDGFTVYVDTISGEEWVDSTNFQKKSKVIAPKYNNLSIGVNLWDPLMRMFGQTHGLIDFSAELDMYNRFFPTVELGFGKANNTPDNHTFTYKTPLTFYARIGMNYNFLFAKNPDYKFFIGLRYGFSPFKWSIENITVNSPYWQENSKFGISEQSATAEWLEFHLGLRVRLTGNLSAGWAFKYHAILHESKSKHGEPWYIPGYGARNQSISGAFTFYYTLPLGKRNSPKDAEAIANEVAGEVSTPSAE